MTVTVNCGLKVKVASLRSPNNSVPGLRLLLLCLHGVTWLEYLVFFAGKKAGSSSEKPSLVKKAPVTVVRSGNLVPEIIRTEKERLETHVEGNMESVFKEGNSQETSLALDEGIKEDVMPHQPE